MLATLPMVCAAGYEVTLAAPARGPLAGLLRKYPVEHVAWHPHEEAGGRRPLLALRNELAELVKRVRPSLLHANSLSTARIAGPVARACNVASIGHLRDIVKLSRQAIADLNQHDRLLAVSDSTRAFHVRQGIKPSLCNVLHNGIDLVEFAPRQATGYLHHNLGLSPECLLAAVIGQLGLRKATDVALAAAAIAAEQFPQLHWLVVGSRTSCKPESCEFESRLRAIAARAPLAGRVHFLGEQAEVSRLLNECALLVHAARQEPLGRVLLEAAASGIAVIATDVGGTREIFPASSRSSILVPPDDPAALASAVEQLCGNESLRQHLAARARERATSAFDIQVAGKKLLSLYEKTIARQT